MRRHYAKRSEAPGVKIACRDLYTSCQYERAAPAPGTPLMPMSNADAHASPAACSPDCRSRCPSEGAPHSSPAQSEARSRQESQIAVILPSEAPIVTAEAAIALHDFLLQEHIREARRGHG